MPKIDMVGRTCGRLTVIAEAGSTRQGNTIWLCVCSCGNQKAILGMYLRDGRTRSCGCLSIEKTIERCSSHGQGSPLNPSPAYRSWQSAKDRCFNSKNKRYQRYGGRGITMCEEWKRDFMAFFR